jgi:uncharacterized repeat protein (TIGR01451 family)
MNRNKAMIGIMLALVLLPAGARAQQEPQKQHKGKIVLTSITEVEVTETNAKGEKEMKRLEIGKSKVVPGNVLVYTTTYRNIGKQPAEDIVITNPVPAHMEYVDRSAEGKGTKIAFSADKGKSYGTPYELTIADAKGKKRGVDAKEYTHLQWTVVKPLPPGGSGRVSFKARLQ